MHALLALSLVACSSSSPTPQPKMEPAPGSAATTTSAATLTPGVELAEVVLSGFDAADKIEPTVSVTLSGLTVDGKLVASLQDGVVKPEELEGGALGMTIIKLGAIAGQIDTSKRIALAIDKRIPYRTMIATLYTLKQAKHKQFGLLARAGAHVVMAPITLPDKRVDSTISVGGRNPGSDLDAQLEAVRQAGRDKITSSIKARYLAGIKRCYKDQLLRDPTASGKLQLTLVIGASGKVTQGKATGMASELGACVEKHMTTWRFPDKAVASGTFTVTLLLAPDADPTPEPQAAPPAPPAPPAPAPAPQAPDPLQLFVTLTKTELLVWSISGEEGTLQKPRLAVKLAEKSALADLNRTLAEIVAKRFATTRVPEDRAIVIQADAATPMQTIAEVIGAVRATPDAKELFPDVQFATGFE